jgi:DNA repair exonuclease SbcCD ATPase subunit
MNLRPVKIIALFVLVLMVIPSSVVSGAKAPLTANVGEAVLLSVEAGEANGTSEDDEGLRANFEKIAEKLLEHSERIRERVNSTLEKRGVDEVPGEVRESLRLGLEALVQARSLFEEGNFEEAARIAHQAMNHFSAAFRNIEEKIPEEPDEEEVKAETEVVGLKVAIERAYAFLDKVEASATNLQDEGYGVDTILAELDNAKASLEQALTLLDRGEVSAAARAMAAAQGTLGRSNGALNSVAKRQKEKRTEGFLEQAWARARNLNGTIVKLQTRLQERNALSVRAALGATEKKLERLRERLGEDDLDDVLDELEDAIEEMDDELEDLNGNNTSTMLKEMNRVEARIRVLQRTEERLRNKGEETPEIQIRLNVSTALLEQIRLRLEAGDLEALKELIEEAEESFKDARDEIQGSKVSGIKERMREKLKDMLETFEEDEPEEDDELIDEIRELKKMIADLEDYMRRLAAAGANATDVEAELQRARNLLREAAELAGEYPEAAEDLIDAAEEAVDEIADLLEVLEDMSEGSETESEEEEEHEVPKGETKGANQTTG